MLESPEDRRRRLYGPARNLRVQEIRDKLSKSCVLKDGEYNLTANKLSEGIFDTSYSRDYLVSASLSSFLVSFYFYLYLGGGYTLTRCIRTDCSLIC